jgi:uncharacterized membrane protein YhhN
MIRNPFQAITISLLLILTGITIGLDAVISYYSWHQPTDTSLLMQSSAVGRFMRTVGCVLLLISVWKAPLSKQDARWLSVALIICVVADYFLILSKQLVIGIGIFGIAQAVLIKRHLKGMTWAHLRQKWYKNGALWTYGLCFLALAALTPALIKVNLWLPVSLYALLLVTSLFAAWCAIRLKQMPVLSAWLAWCGLFLFLLCDITVGLGAVGKATEWGAWIRTTTGLFYTPALVLLVLSGVKTAHADC